MKKIILTGALVGVILFPMLAQAAPWTGGVDAAITSGKLGDIDRIVASNPRAAGDISVYLMQRAQGMLSENPKLAIQLFAAAKPLAPQISATNADKVTPIIAAFLAAAKGMSTDEASCSGASTIYAASLNMTSQPNIAASSATLHQTAAADAKQAIAANSACGTDELNNEVSLAQLDVIPLTNNVGAINPSSD